MTFPFPFFIPSSDDMLVEYLGNAESTTDASSYTFSTLNFGTAASWRQILFSVACRAAGTPTISSALAGGVSATMIGTVAQNTGGGNRSNAAWFIADVPTGPTGDIEVTLSGTHLRCGITWFRARKISATPYDQADSAAAPPTTGAAIDAVAKGYVLGASYNQATGSVTWTGLTGLHTTIIESPGQHSVAVEQFPSGTTGLTVTADWATDTLGVLKVVSLQSI
jgi:hypothetical protein